MTVRQKTMSATVLSVALLMTPASSRGQTPAASSGKAATEVFTATAAVKGAGGASASAPVTITIDRKMSQREADSLVAAFKAGGAAALKKGLGGTASTGTIRIGGGAATPTRFTIERVTADGRLLTILTDQPLLFVGAGVQGAKPKEGYDFAVIDIEVDAKGSGSGTIAPAARIKMNQGAFVVEDYGVEVVRLTAVKKTK
jgi:hypothetical protein